MNEPQTLVGVLGICAQKFGQDHKRTGCGALARPCHVGVRAGADVAKPMAEITESIVSELLTNSPHLCAGTSLTLALAEAV